MPRRKSPLLDQTRSSPVRRHITASPSSGGRAAEPYQQPPIESSYPSLGDSSALSQPSYSETILQRPTIATTDSPSLAFPNLTVHNQDQQHQQPQSRRHSSSSMRNASMTFENVAPTSTPTGRISKAKKGKRVHACEFPGCGKVFTRAEHRRRHELNHNPEAMYRCPQPGCGKAFHRIDLLQRHQERHDLEASAPMSSQVRQSSHPPAMSSPPSVLPASAMTGPPSSEAPRTSSGGLSIGSLVHPQSNSYTSDPHMGGFTMSFIPGYPSSDDQSSYYYTGSDSGASPLSDQFSRYHRPSVSSSSSVAGYENNSVSPMISSSVPGTWMPATAPPSVLPSSMFQAEGAGSYLSSSTVSSMPIPLSDLDGDEWIAIQRELSTIPGLVLDTSGSGISGPIRWHCLDHYWQYFHPSFPIVHHPTFLLAKPSPLLASAMLAIGSYYDTRPDAKIYSLALQEIATKLLRRRQSITSRSRIADLQTVLLLEILSKYCARQVSVHTSSRFRALFASLHQAKHWLGQSPLAVYRTLKQEKTTEDLAKAHKFWVEHETRRRIFHACSVLDTQQVTLFEQPPTIITHDTNRSAKSSGASKNGMDGIHLPCTEDLWDASPIEEWSNFATGHDYVDVGTARNTYQSASVSDYSFFQHQIINSSSNFLQRCSEEISSPPGIGGALSKTRFNFHVMQMARHTPIKHLLTVTGESWLLGYKVEQESDYIKSKNALSDWVGQIAAVQTGGPPGTLVAHWHALKVLRMMVEPEGSQNLFRTTNMLHEDWAVYIAALVCWVHGYRRGWTDSAIAKTLGRADSSLSYDAANNPPQNDATNNVAAPPASVRPHLMDPAEATSETYEYLRSTDVQGPQALGQLVPAVIGRTKGLLEAVRTKKFGHYSMGGLMNESEHVLYRLVEGRAISMF